MDYVTIQSAITSAKTLATILQGLAKLKLDNETLARINDGLQQVADVQQQLFSTNEELFKLQQERDSLRQQIKNFEKWDAIKDNYELVEGEGGAHVFASKSSSPRHYACPACHNKREIQILQGPKGMSGRYECPSCKTDYPINKSENPKITSTVRRTGPYS
jgi:hypothetical protein